MDTREYLNIRKAALLREYLEENKDARTGRRLISLSLIIIFILRTAITVFEIPVFIIAQKPINLTAILLFIPLIMVLYVINNGTKGFAYVILISAAARLILYFSLVYGAMPESDLTLAYSLSLFFILLLQFLLSLLIILAPKCDLCFTAMQRINIKVHGEIMLSQKEKR
jgi:hypothetical protein